jgi:hypothetical protein
VVCVPAQRRIRAYARAVLSAPHGLSAIVRFFPRRLGRPSSPLAGVRASGRAGSKPFPAQGRPRENLIGGLPEARSWNDLTCPIPETHREMVHRAHVPGLVGCAARLERPVPTAGPSSFAGLARCGTTKGTARRTGPTRSRDSAATSTAGALYASERCEPLNPRAGCRKGRDPAWSTRGRGAPVVETPRRISSSTSPREVTYAAGGRRRSLEKQRFPTPIRHTGRSTKERRERGQCSVLLRRSALQRGRCDGEASPVKEARARVRWI